MAVWSRSAETLLPCQAAQPAQLAIDAALSQQLLVGACLGDAALRQDEDPAGVADGGKPVGDDDRCPSFYQTGQGLLYHLLALVVRALPKPNELGEESRDFSRKIE